MSPRVCVALVAALVAVTAAAPAQAAGSGRLIAFRSCRALMSYAKANASRFVGPYGLGSPTAIRSAVPGGVDKAVAPTANAASEPAPVQGVDYSGTNVQETGVDEPDIVKTDGRRVFSIAGGKLQALTVTGGIPTLVGSLALEDISPSELLLSGNRLVVIGTGPPT